MTKLKEWFGICSMILSFQVTLSDDTIITTSSTERDTSFLDFFIEQKKAKPKRNTESATELSISFQFENSCTGSQPSCTCYYPDYPDVTIFELSTDQTTQNASGINGTGPANCEDLHKLYHNLKGFYMVRFNSERVKTIYCEFDDINQNKYNKPKKTKRSSKDTTKKTPKPKKLRFCGGVGHAPCTFYYSDNPDAPLTTKKPNDSTDNNNEVGPESCEDLKNIRYSLKGFYMVRLNAIKVKTVYCDFGKRTLKDDKNKLNNILPTAGKNATGAISKTSRFCQGVGSQPCSCYSTKSPNILQYELSSDEITRNASREDGKGPKNCKDLKEFGHILSGFYVVRHKTNRMKIIFCKFDEKGLSETTQREEETTTKVATTTSIEPAAFIMPLFLHNVDEAGNFWPQAGK